MHANSGSIKKVTDLYSFRYLAVVTALASEADFVFIPEAPPSVDWREKLCDKLEQASLSLSTHFVYVILMFNASRHLNFRVYFFL